MPSGLFKRENDRWVFSGPIPASLRGYQGDHADLLVRYMFHLTPEEQRACWAALQRHRRRGEVVPCEAVLDAPERRSVAALNTQNSQKLEFFI